MLFVSSLCPLRETKEPNKEQSVQVSDTTGVE